MQYMGDADLPLAPTGGTRITPDILYQENEHRWFAPFQNYCLIGANVTVRRLLGYAIRITLVEICYWPALNALATAAHGAGAQPGNTGRSDVDAFLWFTINRLRFL